MVARYDERKGLIYILVNTREHYVLSSGFHFGEFVRSLKKPLTNLLLLKHKYGDSQYHHKTRLEYVLKNQVKVLTKRDLHKSEEFCWIDFDDVYNLDTIEPEELAQLLYLGHMKEHLTPPFFQNINNRFVYLTECDGLLNKVYYRYWSDFYDVLGGILTLKVNEMKFDSLIGFRKKRVLVPVERKILHHLNSALTEGIVFSLHHSHTRGDIRIPFRVVGDFNDMDEMLEQYKSKSKQRPDGEIVFDRKKKEWYLQN